MKMICPICNQENESIGVETNYCSKCGLRLADFDEILKIDEKEFIDNIDKELIKIGFDYHFGSLPAYYDLANIIKGNIEMTSDLFYALRDYISYVIIASGELDSDMTVLMIKLFDHAKGFYHSAEEKKSYWEDRLRRGDFIEESPPYPLRWSEIDECEWSDEAIKQYYDDIPAFKLVSHYLHLEKVKGDIYQCKMNSIGKIIVNKEVNKIYVNEKEINPEEFVELMEGDVNPAPIIKKITGIDLDDYVTTVYYEGGRKQSIDIAKRKKQIRK